jgi:hypothetical protein
MPANKISGQTSITMIGGFQCEHYVDTAFNYCRNIVSEGAYYSGIKVFNSIPSNIKKLFCDVKRFKLDLGKYLHLKSFYTLGEYFNSTKS